MQRKTSSETESLLQSLGVSSAQGRGRGQLKEALKGVGLPCGVCGSAKSDVTLMPCQHKCVCSACSSKVNRCPLCEEEVKDKVNTGPGNNNFMSCFYIVCLWVGEETNWSIFFNS